MSLLIPSRIAPQTVAAAVKAVTGAGATALTYGTPLWSLQNTPQRRAYAAARMYHENYLIRLAERPVSTKGGSAPWHLETPDHDIVGTEDDEVNDPALLAIQTLLDRPQDALPADDRQPGMLTGRGMRTTTLRHMGLCGTAFWYLDQTDALAGIPLAILYIAPWRMFEVTDQRTGRLLGWTLDKPADEGGMPLTTRDVLPFYLEPPDTGHWASGLVEAAGNKAMLDPAIDRHIASVLGAGGRLTGLLSPKVGASVTEDQWAGFIRDWRQIVGDPAAAQRLQIVQSPVDFVKTAATPDEMSLVDIDERTRDAILALWGVPGSQVGIAAPAGLNSGSTKSFDEAVLWQGAIHPRLEAMRETVQDGILARYAAVGLPTTLVIEEPEFDDDAPLYAKAVQAVNLPLTVAETRELVGKQPFGDEVVDDLGRIVDKIVMLPTGQSEAFYADKLPPAVMEQAAIQREAAANLAANPPDQPQKASRFTGIRERLDKATVPAVRNAVKRVLGEQKAAVTEYLQRAGLDHLRRKAEFRWNAAEEDKRLAMAMAGPLRKMVAAASTRIQAAFPGKASATDDFAAAVVRRVLTRGAGRVSGINETTRTAIREALAVVLESAGTIDEVIRAVSELDVFDELRAETIARTESMFAYNDAALGSYQELGVTEVEAIDGDEDEECAARNGQTFTIEEAESIEDHPNGTLDWVPVIPDEPEQKAHTFGGAEVATIKGLTDYITAMENRPPAAPPIVNIEPTPAPQVIVDTSEFAAALASLRESQAALIEEMRRPRVRTPIRDEKGKIVRVEEA